MKMLVKFLMAFVVLVGCRHEKQSEQSQPYNILWLVCEDMGPYIPPFGDSTIVTPNLSRLAEEGVRYPHLFSTSGVCAPSRFAIATGMYPSGSGANHMRTHSNTKQTGLRPYEAVPKPEVKMFSELLRKAGYYCSNNEKEDYQFKKPVTAWDESGMYAHWRNREEGQPFFSIFNFTTTHESGLFEPYGIRHRELRHYNAGDRTLEYKKTKTAKEETPVHLPKDKKFNVPPYLPDNEISHYDMWKMYNNIAEMDKQLGAVLDQLEADGLMDKTIIFFYADHGGPLPRQKRLIYDSGLNSPMIVRFPDKRKAGTINGQLVSFIDLAPTVLSIVGQALPEYLQGIPFLNSTTPERKYIHAAADRFDETTDAIRAVRDKRFKYIRNYRPQQGYYLPLAYREKIPTMQELLRLRDNGQLNETQAQWFREQKPQVELFDCVNDPHELKNLADDPQYADKIKELGTEMDRWLAKIGDQPNLPEAELIEQLWEGSETQPVTSDPIVKRSGSRINIECDTEGASIAYQLESSSNTAWQVYQGTFEVPPGEKVIIQAHRIGYKPSKIIEQE